MTIRLRASVYEKVVGSEDDAIDLLDGLGKYERWFWAGEDGGLWLMDMALYHEKDYSGSGLCIVFAGGLFPKYDIITGEFIESIIGWYDSWWHTFACEPDSKLIEKYHGELVEIVGDIDAVV